MADHDPRSKPEAGEEPPARPPSDDQRLLDEEIKTLPPRIRERIKQRTRERLLDEEIKTLPLRIRERIEQRSRAMRWRDMDDDIGPGMDWID